MSRVKASSLLFLLWFFLGFAVWWRELRSPALFLVVALLTGLGAQEVSSALWIMWLATSNQFSSIPASEVRAAQLHELAFHVVATFGMLATVYWRLSKRL